MITDIKQQWIMLIPMNDMPVYSFACPECMNSVIKFLDDNEWKYVKEVDPIKECVVCGRNP